MAAHYSIECLANGTRFTEDTLQLFNPDAAEPAFLRTVYPARPPKFGPAEEGIYRFAEWLPIRRRLEGSSAPITYRSRGLAEHLGLENLFVTFSGYWPERGARMLTGTFKECEAYSVCARMGDDFDSVLVVSSAGNTARAFARVCSDNRIPLLITIPEQNLDSTWSIGPLAPTVKIVVASGDSDYADAIHLGGIIASLPGYTPEGGAKNIARRDGMGTTVLSAVEAIGEIPHHYFQAVGSGTGAIAAWEANLRFIETGAYGNRKMRLHVSQNAPFQILHDSWTAGQRTLVELDEETARSQVAQINAKVLANRHPPYSPRGGLFDALTDSNGTTAAIPNDEASAAGAIFRETEGVDVAVAASVAVADLIRHVESGAIAPEEIVMLNATGGGQERIRAELNVVPVTPACAISRNDFTPEAVASAIKDLFFS